MEYNYEYHKYFLKKIESFDKTSLKQAADLTNNKEPKTLKELAAETAALNVKKLPIATLNPDALWLLFRTFSRDGRLTDELLQMIVEESECRFYDIEKYQIRFNMKMTYKGLKYLTELMPNLRFLDISGSNFALSIQTYQHLLSRNKLKEIRTNTFADKQFNEQLSNLAEVFNWKTSTFFDVMTKRL